MWKLSCAGLLVSERGIVTMASSATTTAYLDNRDRLSTEQYAAIGRVAVLWSEVEWGMERIIGRLALIPLLLGYVLTYKLGPDNRIEAIHSLIQVHKIKYHGELVDRDPLAEINAVLPSLKRLKDDRNFVVHSLWSKAGDEFLSRLDIAATARSGFDFSVGPCERLVDIVSFGDEVHKAAIHLMTLGARIPTIDATLLDKLREQEKRNRQLPGLQSTRQFQRRSYAKLQTEVPPETKRIQKGMGAKS